MFKDIDDNDDDDDEEEVIVQGLAVTRCVWNEAYCDLLLHHTRWESMMMMMRRRIMMMMMMRMVSPSPLQSKTSKLQSSQAEASELSSRLYQLQVR